MPVNPLGYALDLQANNPANFIVNEIHTFTAPVQRLFVPSAGPFYNVDFEIRNNTTNAILQPNVDYKIVHMVRDAVRQSGKSVNAGIYVHNTNIASVRVSYRVIGGIYADTSDVIRELFQNDLPTNPDTIPWGKVFGAPAQMPPVEHLHDMLDTYGYGNLITVLEQLRVAVMSGDGPAIDAIYRYVELMLNNADYVTMQEVINLISQDTSNQVKVYATYADLRAETAFINNADLLYVTLGKNTRYDGKGRMFVWSVASTENDDNDFVVKPTIVLNNGNGPGRLLSTQQSEKDITNSLLTLGRKIDNNGNILTNLDTTFALDAVDLDTALNSGVFFVKPNCTNKPLGNTQGHLFVEKSDIHVIQHFISTIQDDRNKVAVGDVNIAVPTAHTFNRVGRLVGGNYVWEDWRGLIDRDTLNIALQSLGRKIDVDFKVRSDLVNGTNNTFTGDLNTLILPGPWYVAPTSTNMPIGAERGTVDVLQSGIFISQTFSSIIQEYDITDVSQTVTNGPEVIRPTVFKRILTLNVNLDTVDTVGEWISFADLPTINRALRTLGRKVENDFSVITKLDQVTSPITGEVNLNDVKKSGSFALFGNPDDPGNHVNWPYGVWRGVLKVEEIDNNIIQTITTIYDNERGGVNDPAGTNPRDDGIVAPTRYSRVMYSLAGDWTEWIRTLDIYDSRQHGLQNAISTTNVLSSLADFNNLSNPGKYWFGDTQLNRPFERGILVVELVAGTIAEPIEINQNAYWDGRSYMRSRNHLGVWSPWLQIAHRDLVTNNVGRYSTTKDLNEVMEPGKYYYDISSTNRPTDFGILTVKCESNDIVYQEAHGADNTKHVRYRANNGTWTRWLKAMDSIEMERHGINTGIATHYALSPTDDLDLITTPGKYYLGDTQVNRPGDFGILEVELISGTIDSPGDIEQTFKCSLLGVFATRRRYWNGIAHVWDVWRRRALRNGEASQSFAMFSHPINLIDPTHGVNAAFLATQMATLWARLTANGIDAAVSVTNAVPHYNDLDDLIVVGKYWIGDTIQNAPFNWAVVEVEMVVAGNIIQTVYDGYRKTTRRTASSGATWSDWHYSIHLNIAEESSKDNMSLDSALTPGEYYYTPNTISRPSPYGLVKVWRETDDIVYQEAHGSDNNKYIRYRSGLGVWTPWLRLANANDLAAIPSYNTEIPFFEDTAPYYWTLPADVTSIIISLCAGGGGGGQGGGNDAGAEYGGGGGGGASGQWAVIKVDNVVPGSTITINVGYGGLGGSGSAWNNSLGNGAKGQNSSVSVTTSFGTETYVVFGGLGGAVGAYGDDNGSNPSYRGSGGAVQASDATPSIFVTLMRYGQVPGVGGGQVVPGGLGGKINRVAGGTTEYLTGDGGNGSSGGLGITSSAPAGQDGAPGRVVLYY